MLVLTVFVKWSISSSGEDAVLYEIISPDAWLRPMLDDYLGLAQLHALARGAFGSGKPLRDDLMKKTAALVREHASLLEGPQRALAPVRLDETALAALKSNKTLAED